MRYRTLVIAAFLAVLASIAPTADAQKAVMPAQKAPPPVEIKPVDDVIVDYLAKVDRGLGSEDDSTYVMGRISDFSGRSVRGAEVVLFSLDSDDIKRVFTNAFGYYRFSDLSEGESYLISVQHRRFLFVGSSVSFIVERSPIQIDFQAEEMR